MNAQLAFAISNYRWELAGVAAGLVTLTGVWFRWRSQWHVADVEDEIKDGKISGDAGQRRMRFLELRSTVLIFGGLLALLLVMVGAGM